MLVALVEVTRLSLHKVSEASHVVGLEINETRKTFQRKQDEELGVHGLLCTTYDVSRDHVQLIIII